ncbi:hypothetical protein CC2G_007890 [Coprinopsis cinerea AmutBmut pab1-1]|nr:hypothetical protein CC2G_007890 [Coprinopsis cinerea AmutBmut pab1-1]
MTQMNPILPTTVDILILGAGWTSTFLIPLCEERSLVYGATTRNGRDGTIGFVFDPESDDLEPYRRLPDARTVLITFPITFAGGSVKLVKSYIRSRDEDSREHVAREVQFIQLGSTGIWEGGRGVIPNVRIEPPRPAGNEWYDRHSDFERVGRAREEEELLKLPSDYGGSTVLNLAGLWGGGRSPRRYLLRVAPTKEALRHKGSVHFIHGVDVARSILAVHSTFGKAKGQRWIVTDGCVYDWWTLASAWGGDPGSGDNKNEDAERGPYPRWVRELMEDSGVRGLARVLEDLRAYAGDVF